MLVNEPYCDPKYLLLSRPSPFNHLDFFKYKFKQALLYQRINYPFLSGDSFAYLADYYAYGRSGNKRISLRKLRRAKVIFIAGHNLEQLLNNYFKDITASVVICGNSDKNFDTVIRFPNSVKLWLCQNNSTPNTTFKLTIPIGLENMRLARAGNPNDFKSQDRGSPILDKVLMPPMWATNPDRYNAVYKALENPQIFDVYREYVPNHLYQKYFSHYKFVFCCEGAGYENHRIWESLYRGNFPVMLDTKWARTLIDLELPILLISSISELTAEHINSHLQKWQNWDPKICQTLWMPYWKNLILNVLGNY